MLENLKYSMILFIKYAWIKKAIFSLVLWIIIYLGLYIEPILISTSIWYIEDFYNTWIIDFPQIYKTFAFWLIIWVLISILWYYHRYYLIDVICLEEETWEFSTKWERILRMNFWDYLSEKPWEIYKTLDRWTSAIFSINFWILRDYLKSIFWVLWVFVIMFIINWKLATATFLMVPFLISAWLYFNLKTVKVQKKLHKEWSAVYWTLWNFITNMQLVKNFSLEKKAMNIIEEKKESVLEKQLEVSKRWSFSDIFTSSLIIFSRILVMWTWTYLMYKWETTFAEITLFVAMVSYVYNPIGYIFWNLRTIQESLTSIWEYRDKFENMKPEKDSDNSVNINSTKWEIEFKNVDFSYNENRRILKNLNLKIKQGEKIALVWHTGSWKSTIINLILRLWEINSWKILLDWNDIKNINYESLRWHIWVVSQDNSLFNGTILENMQIIKEDATIQEIENSLKKAKADFVFKLKDWLNSEIWERWLKLSGWEKQRISIARIFLKNPEIFILDEATSALDNKTEIEIQESLNELMENKTSIIIAHRLSTIQHVDRIIMLENWEIIEEWTYEELINKWWKFADLASPSKSVVIVQ